MTVAQITAPAQRTEALAGHAYCLPVVRELPVPGRDAESVIWVRVHADPYD